MGAGEPLAKTFALPLTDDVPVTSSPHARLPRFALATITIALIAAAVAACANATVTSFWHGWFSFHEDTTVYGEPGG